MLARLSPVGREPKVCSIGLDFGAALSRQGSSRRTTTERAADAASSAGRRSKRRAFVQHAWDRALLQHSVEPFVDKVGV